MLIHRVETRGGKWAMELHQDSGDTFSITDLKHDSVVGRSCGYKSLNAAMVDMNRRIQDAANIDGINYLGG